MSAATVKLQFRIAEDRYNVMRLRARGLTVARLAKIDADRHAEQCARLDHQLAAIFINNERLARIADVLEKMRGKV